MNPYAAVIMVSTAVIYIGLLVFALLSDLPWLLALLALMSVYGLTPPTMVRLIKRPRAAGYKQKFLFMVAQ